MLEAGDVITAEEAERRVLVLENPSLRGQSRITNSLFAGVQLIMPGEIAEAHQHVSSAIRFVLDGEGAYTAVEGEKANMSRGDFILTPNWAPHDHGNPGKQPVMWLDVLDMPTVNHFETSFMSTSTRRRRTPRARTATRSTATARACCRTARSTPFKNRSPVINYTYARTKPIIERMMKAGDIDPVHGARVRYSNPVTGGHVMLTMGAYLALFPKGFKGKDYQSTDGTIFVCVEGRGSTKVGDKELSWGPNDVFVIPPWQRYSHNVARRVGAVLDLRQAGAGSARHLAREEVSVAGQLERAKPRRKAGLCARVRARAQQRASDPGRRRRVASGSRRPLRLHDRDTACCRGWRALSSAAGDRSPAARCPRRCR